MKTKVFTVLGWVILVVTALFFVMVGSQKLMGSEDMVALFQDRGLLCLSLLFISNVERK